MATWPTWPSWPTWPTWQTAWQEALYGAAGFYRRPEGPAGHFRTAAHAGADALAEAISRLAERLGCSAVVDVGAGRGELLTALSRRDCTGDRELRLHGVDVVPRPGVLPSPVGWTVGLDCIPQEAFAGALVIAWELLDTVPCPVLERDDSGRLRVVHTDPGTGRERLGEPAGAEHLGWCQRWWPVPADPGDRAEVGLTRDEVWAGLVRVGLAAGAVAFLAVDYAHSRADRPPGGSLAGYRRGRLVPPIADGSCDVTAHVALDAVAAAGHAAGPVTTTVSSQARALADLGVGRVELLDPDGLGGFGWLLQTRSGGV